MEAIRIMTVPGAIFLYFMKLQKSKTPNWWVVTHVKHGIVIRFQEGAFNDTQEVTTITDLDPDTVKIHTVMREIGDWLAENHRDLL